MGQVAYVRHDRVGTIVMNRGPVNGIDISFVRDFDAAVGSPKGTQIASL